MQTVTETYESIKYFVQLQIDKSIAAAQSSFRGGGSSGSPSSNYLLKTGDTITGPIAVNTGVTIDGEIGRASCRERVSSPV